MSIKVLTRGAMHLTAKRVLSPFWMRRKWLAETQWYDKKNIEQLQLQHLKRIINHSYNSVPYYKKIMDEHGIKPEHIKTLEDIKLLPVITKKDVLEAEDAIISNRYPRWTLKAARTGGSTGMPLIIYRNWFSVGNEHAFVRRQWDWAGLNLADRCAYLMSRVVAAPDQENDLYKYDPVMKDLILSTHHLSGKTAPEYAEAIKKYNVKAIVGYPSAISFLARVCLEHNISLDLKAVLTTSEILMPVMRQAITGAFCCRVFDFYGGAERVCYIHSCEYGNYHIIPEYGLTELIPAFENKENCYRIVATGFWNLAMPLIRYDTGDIVVKSDKKCSCGRQFEVVDSIEGREGDVIKTPSGRQFGVTLIIQLLYVICGTRYILESRVIQDAIDHLTIEYVPHEKFQDKDLENFKGLISKNLCEELKFDFRKVSSIEKTESGKVKPLVSLINS